MNTRLPGVAAVTLAGMLLASASAAQSPQSMSYGWRAHGTLDDFDVARDTLVGHGGRASVRFVADEPPASFAGISAGFRASPYEGRRIRVSAWLRGASLGGGGGVVWARADGGPFAFVTSQQRPLLGTTPWTPVEVMLDVPRGATGLVLGAYSSGQGTLWIDDIEVKADSGPDPLRFGFEEAADFTAPTRRVVARSLREAAHAISDRGLENVSAFTRLLGYVRFFHPAQEAATVNWDELAVRGMRAVEGAPTSDSLAATLRALFAPIAPTVVLYRTGGAVPAPPTAPSPGAGVVYWQHMGTGSPSGGPTPSSQQNIYKSTRVLVPGSAVGTPMQIASSFRALASDAALPSVPDPAKPLQLMLGAGLSVSLPLAVYSDQGIPDSLQSARPAAGHERFSADDRATRLATVALAWGVMQHFYPYHEIVHTDWPAALRASLQRAAADRDGVAFSETMERLIAALHDGHGNVSGSSVQRIVPDVRLGWVEGKVVVLAAGDSAAAAGLHRGDVILSVDGRAAADVLATRSERISGATAQWVRNVALGRMLEGPPKTSIALRVSSAEKSTPKDVLLPRTSLTSATEKKPEKIAELSPGVFYVDIDRITDADFEAALPRLASARGLVFDMRGYPRQVNTAAILAHLADTTIRSARFEVPLVTRPDRVNTIFFDGGWTIPPAAPRIRAHVAFLTGGGAISYAESTMGVVEGFRLGDIVGEPTAGTNGNVNPFTLPGSLTVYWTGMRVTKRDGTPHHGVGIAPTVPVSPTLAGIRAGRDEVLERAVQIVGGAALIP